jgi:aspartate carbamoyltransferase catalytic subunit
MQLRHLLSINDLEAQQIQIIFERAAEFKDHRISRGDYRKATALIFLENSTRTRISFERASQELGKPVVNLMPAQSSLEKGETLIDTLENLAALHCDLAIIRCTDEKWINEAAKESPISILNAGDGTREHPTQALLDLFTLWNIKSGRDWAALRKLRIAIVGDLLHSRVAQSWSLLAQKMDLEVEFFSPKAWKPQGWPGSFRWSDRFRPRIAEFDVVMALRVQKERLRGSEKSGAKEEAFVSHFQIAARDLKEHQSLMHPGPVNWGVELHENLQKDPRSLILDQVNVGLYLRAALVETYSTERKKA